jgi:Large polyvalent protein associated domain 38/ADP-Ribosyltransferase in polyvalent proteins
MAFDVEGAFSAGYSPADVADYLGKEKKFDVAGAREAGYSDQDIIVHLSNIKVPKKEEREGFVGSLKKGAEQVASTARTAYESVTKSPEEAVLAAQKRNEEIESRYGKGASLEDVQKIYREKGFAEAAAETVRQIPTAIAEQGANLVSTIGGAGVGALAAGPVGAVAGAALPSFIQQYGGNLERQAQVQQEAGKPLDISRGKAALTAIPQTALDVAETFIPLGGRLAGKVFGPTVGKLLGAGEGAAAEKLAKEGLLATIGKGTATGVFAEVPAEVTQQMLERAQAGLPLLDESAMKEYGETAFDVTLLGPLGILGRVANKADARAKVLEAQQKAKDTNQPQEVPLLTYDPNLPNTRGTETFIVYPDGKVAPSAKAAEDYEFEKKYAPQPGPRTTPETKGEGILYGTPEGDLGKSVEDVQQAKFFRNEALQKQAELNRVVSPEVIKGLGIGKTASIFKDNSIINQSLSNPDVADATRAKLLDIQKAHKNEETKKKITDFLSRPEFITPKYVDELLNPPLEMTKNEAKALDKHQFASVGSNGEIQVKYGDIIEKDGKKYAKYDGGGGRYITDDVMVNPDPATMESWLLSKEQDKIDKIPDDFKEYLAKRKISTSEMADLGMSDIPKNKKGSGIYKTFFSGQGASLDGLANDAMSNGLITQEDLLRHGKDEVEGMRELIRDALINDYRVPYTPKNFEAIQRAYDIDQRQEALNEKLNQPSELVSKEKPTEPVATGIEELAPEEKAPVEAETSVKAAEAFEGAPAVEPPRAEVSTPFTDKFIAEEKKLAKQLRSALDRMGLKDVGLKLEDAVHEYVNGKMTSVNGSYFNKLIKLSLSGDNMFRTMSHEALHAMKELGFFSPADWKILENKARSEWMEKYDIASKYGKETQEVQLEEAIAFAFADHNKQLPLIKRIMNAAVNALKALGNVFRANGYRKAEDIFQEAAAGKLKAGKYPFKYTTADEVYKMQREAYQELAKTDAFKKLQKRIDDARKEYADRFDAVKAEAVRLLKAHPEFKNLADALTDKKIIDRVAMDAFQKQAEENVPLPKVSEGQAIKDQNKLIQDYFDSKGIPEPREFSESANQQRRYYSDPRFKKWFGDSKVVDKNGQPLVAFHSTDKDFSEFNVGKGAPARTNNPDYTGQLGSWFTAPSLYDREYEAGNAENAVTFSEGKEGDKMMPVHLSIKNPMEYEGFEDLRDDRDSYKSIEEYKKSLIDQGYDGIVVRNSMTDGNVDRDDWVAFEPTQIKSAIGNIGEFNPTNPDIRAEVPEKLKANLNDVDPAYADKIIKQFAQEKATVKEKFEGFKKGFFDRMVTGLFDEFRAIKEYSPTAYMQARLSKSIDGGLQGLLEHGQVFLRDGALDIRPNTKGLLDILAPLGSEVDQYQIWKALNRDAKMPADKRSFDTALVAGRDNLIKGTINGKSRKSVYETALKEENELNRSVLDVAKETGLIDQEAYNKFSNDIYYIPFYKAMEDGDVQSIGQSSKLTGQYFSKSLKGGEKKTNDLMENVLMNWSHILSASMKNQAAVNTIKAAKDFDVAERATPMGGKYPPGTVKVMEDGKVSHYTLTDPDLVDAISTISYLGPKSAFLDIAKGFTNTLRYGITLSPAYKVRNLIRDSIQSAAISELSPNMFANVYNGLRMSKDGHPTFMSALAGGGIFEMGVAHEGNQAKLIKALIDKGVKDTSILDTSDKIKGILPELLRKYNELGNKFENANRLALYQKLIDSGKTHLEASYAARDLMDFSMQGQFRAVKVIGSVVPFFNARLQGLYKLGRDGITPTYRVICNATTGKPLEVGDKQKAMHFTVMSGAVMLASMALYSMYKDDEDFQRREDWDRDNFWWFKVGDVQYRIPKPFEIGALGTVAERTLEQISDQDVEGKVFFKRMNSILMDTFSMNPMPQIFKPLIDIYSNKDSFTGAPIESAGMENLSKQERQNDKTSGIAKALGGISAGAHKVLTFNPDAEGLSPIQMDYMIKAYLGWAGATAVATADRAIEPFEEGTKVHPPIIDQFAMGFIKTEPETRSKYLTNFYQNNENLQSAMADMRHYAELGEAEKVQKIIEEKGSDIALSKSYDQTSKQFAKIRKAIKMIENNTSIPEEERRAEMNRLKILMSDTARDLESMRKSIKQ